MQGIWVRNQEKDFMIMLNDVFLVLLNRIVRQNNFNIDIYYLIRSYADISFRY